MRKRQLKKQLKQALANQQVPNRQLRAYLDDERFVSPVETVEWIDGRSVIFSVCTYTKIGEFITVFHSEFERDSDGIVHLNLEKRISWR